MFEIILRQLSVHLCAMIKKVTLSANFITLNALCLLQSVWMFVCVFTASVSNQANLRPRHHPVLGPPGPLLNGGAITLKHHRPGLQSGCCAHIPPPGTTTPRFRTSLELGETLDMLPNHRHSEGSSIASQIKDALDTDSRTNLYIGRGAQPEANGSDSSTLELI